jgi:hypothetical protein
VVAVLYFISRSSWWGIVATFLLVGCVETAMNAAETVWPDLSGDWAVVQKLVATAHLPVVGGITIDTVIGSVTHITQSGSQLILQDHYGFTDARPSSPLFRTNIADEVMESIAPQPRTARLVLTDCDFRFVQDLYTEVRGAVLQDSVDDPLPTEVDDPRVIDLEGDGHPGMTIQASILGLFTGEGYAVQRYRYRLDGTVLNGDTVVGFIDWTSEQNMLAATNPLFMEAFTSSTDPDPAKHRFVMVRTDGVWTTDRLRENLPGLLNLLDF